jgi:AcrR family transcriptional regulator
MRATGTGGTAPRGYRSPRREMQARRTRARIIAAAAQRFRAHGYAGTTMRAVALDAGVALPTVELAFRTKARLLKAVIDVAIAGDDDQVAMLDRQWAKRAESIAGPPDFVAAFARVLAGSAERAAGLAATALEAARADEDIATVAAQLMSQREVMASWLVDGIMHRSALREGTDRAAAVDTVWTLMDPVVFCRLTGDRHWTTAHFERWFTDSVTRLVLSADNTR